MTLKSREEENKPPYKGVIFYLSFLFIISSIILVVLLSASFILFCIQNLDYSDDIYSVLMVLKFFLSVQFVFTGVLLAFIGISLTLDIDKKTQNVLAEQSRMMNNIEKKIRQSKTLEDDKMRSDDEMQYDLKNLNNNEKTEYIRLNNQKRYHQRKMEAFVKEKFK